MNRIGDSLFHTGANEEIIRTFSQNAVEFIVIGGLAVAWYCSEGQADDMDILVNPTTDNSVRICKSLDSLHLNGHNVNSFAKLGVQVSLKEIHYADILTPRKSDPQYSEVAEDAVDAKLFNISVRVASIASLIRMKKLAVESAEGLRDKHLNDIELLKIK